MSLIVDNPPVTHGTVDRIADRLRARGWAEERIAVVDAALRRSVPAREPGDDDDVGDQDDDGDEVLVPLGEILRTMTEAKGRDDGAGRRKRGLDALIEQGES